MDSIAFEKRELRGNKRQLTRFDLSGVIEALSLRRLPRKPLGKRLFITLCCLAHTCVITNILTTRKRQFERYLNLIKF